jgi:hypothetical protein
MEDAIVRARQRASRQQGLVTWDQMLRHSFAPSTVLDWERRGLLERIAPAVYRFAGAPETWTQRVMAAALDSGGWASHRTAAALENLDGHRGSVIEVVVSRWARSSRHDGYLVHETKDLRGCDLTTRYGIPCTPLPRTLIDLPAVEPMFKAEQALDDACRKHPDVLPAVRARFVQLARQGRNGIGIMRLMLEERPGGYIPPGSTFERMALRWIDGTDIERPEKQLKVTDGDFTAYLDLAWPRLKFGVECDSLAFHFSKAAHTWDRKRRRHLKRLGWEVVEFTYEEVKSGAFLRELRELLVLASQNAVSRAD